MMPPFPLHIGSRPSCGLNGRDVTSAHPPENLTSGSANEDSAADTPGRSPTRCNEAGGSAFAVH